MRRAALTPEKLPIGKGLGEARHGEKLAILESLKF